MMRSLYLIVIIMLLLPFCAVGKGASYQLNPGKKVHAPLPHFPLTEKQSAYFPDANYSPTVQLTPVIVAFLIGFVRVSDHAPLLIKASFECHSSLQQGLLRTVISANAP